MTTFYKSSPFSAAAAQYLHVFEPTIDQIVGSSYNVGRHYDFEVLKFTADHFSARHLTHEGTQIRVIEFSTHFEIQKVDDGFTHAEMKTINKTIEYRNEAVDKCKSILINYRNLSIEHIQKYAENTTDEMLEAGIFTAVYVQRKISGNKIFKGKPERLKAALTEMCSLGLIKKLESDVSVGVYNFTGALYQILD